MPTIKGFMAVSNSDFMHHEGRQVYISRVTGHRFRPMHLSRPAAEQNCGEHEQVEAVELKVGDNDFFRLQHGHLRCEYTDYRHYRNALRRWKAAGHPYAEILWMQQRTEVTDTITFADDQSTAAETATNYEDHWLSNCLTFPERSGGAQ